MVKMILNILLAAKILKKNRPLCIFVPNMSAYGKDFDKTECTSFLIKYEKLLEKHDEIWKKKSAPLPKKYLAATMYTMKNI